MRTMPLSGRGFPQVARWETAIAPFPEAKINAKCLHKANKSRRGYRFGEKGTQGKFIALWRKLPGTFWLAERSKITPPSLCKLL
jgi:hypothetical protein